MISSKPFDNPEYIFVSPLALSKSIALIALLLPISVISVKGNLIEAVSVKETIANLSFIVIKFTRYLSDSFTSFTLDPLILPESSTTHIRSTPLVFSLLSSLDNLTTSGVSEPV